MKLTDLLAFDDIVVQCHNDPDADTIACGFALCEYLKSEGKTPRLVYSGRFPLVKPDLETMCAKCGIPLDFVEHPEQEREAELLVTVDCRAGQGNVARLPCKNLAVIDHHKLDDGERLPALSELRDDYGACATVVWDMLREAGFERRMSKELATALYFGLYIDTGYFKKMKHQKDTEMQNALDIDRSMFDQMKYASLCLEDLILYGKALSNPHCSLEYHFAVVEIPSLPRDPNLLGIVNDVVIGVPSIDVGVTYCKLEDGAKISVRSKDPNIQANRLAPYITRGDGGGHSDMAGGTFTESEVESNCRGDNWDGPSGAVGRLIFDRVTNFFEEQIRRKASEGQRERGQRTAEDQAASLQALRELAEQGDAEAQYELGSHYARGEGVAQDWTQAVSWYRRAAGQGSAAAQHSLGVCYAYGMGVKRDQYAAVSWYRKAAEQDYALAQKEMGVCYATGRGVTQDWVQAANWYSRAAANGDARAQCNLAQRYYKGQGVAQSYEQAVYWFSKSAQQGDSYAQTLLGDCYANGKGVAEDWPQAVLWYTQAMELGNDDARSRLVSCYEQGRPGVPQDLEKAALLREQIEQ